MLDITSKSNRLRCLAGAVLCTATIGIGLTPPAAASDMDKKTIVTFSSPVEVPGEVLPAGTYVFKLLDSTSNRNIVQIFEKDEKKLYATILAIPDYRLKPADKPLIQFEERDSGSPPALRAWAYPSDEMVQQFVYPHDRAVQLAKRTHQNVLSMRNDMAKNITTPAKTATDSSVQELQKTEVTGVNESGEPVAIEIVILEKPDK